MPFPISHIHVKAREPRKTADWWVGAFGFKVVSDETRPFGDRFVRCVSENGVAVNFSDARKGETLGPGNAAARYGLEHFAIDVENIETEIARLIDLGATLQEGPLRTANGTLFAFLTVPDDVRVELIEQPKAG